MKILINMALPCSLRRSSLNVKDVSSHLDKKLPRVVLFVSPKKPGPLGNDPGKQQAGNENETNTV